MDNNECNQELINIIKSLQNEINSLKKKNKTLDNQIKDLKKNAVSLEKFDTLNIQDLKFNNINLNGEEAILDNENSVQYGPYIKYPKGKYCIVYYGNNLHKLSYDCCDNEGKNLLKINNLYEFSNKFAYDVFLPENNKCIEFRARGKIIDKKLRILIKIKKEKYPISIIKKIEVYKYNNCKC